MTDSTHEYGLAVDVDLYEAPRYEEVRPKLRDRLAARINRLPGPGLMKELILWYSLTWPMLFIRVPLIYFLYQVVGLPLWAAIITQFAIERPVFYLVATRLVHPTAKGARDDSV